MSSNTHTNMSDSFKNAMNTLKNMKESTSIFIITVITFMIMIIAILYYIYYATLRSRECKFMDSIYGTLNGKIKPIRQGMEEFSYNLNDYYIKTAYNCCSGGNYRNDYVDICCLKDCLKQGIRGLDFEIYSINDQPVVATSTIDDNCVKETFNFVAFVDVMNVIRDYAFGSSSTCPNPTDPLIIHLRIKSSNLNMYKNFAKLLESYSTILLGKEYSYENQGRNLGNNKLVDFLRKAIIIVDRTNNSFLEVQEFYEYVNMTSNSTFMRALHYYDIKYSQDIQELIEFNRRAMTIGMPDKGANPPNPSGIVLRETGTQMIAMRLQNVDINIEESDVFFDNNGYAFVLKPENLRYVPITIPTPPAQNPAVSYGTRTVTADYYNFDI